MRVHPEILRTQGLPDALLDEDTVWPQRYRSIVNLEQHLSWNGTRIVKFFLHLSEEEQRKRLLERVDDPDKNWKITQADVDERAFWNDYMKAYEACIQATTTEESPWYIVPADDKKTTRLIVSEIILELFKGLDMSFPQLTAERKRELRAMRRKLKP